MSLLGDFQPELKALRVCSWFHYLLLFFVIPGLFIFLFNAYTIFLTILLLFIVYCVSPELVFILESLLTFF